MAGGNGYSVFVEFLTHGSFRRAGTEAISLTLLSGESLKQSQTARFVEVQACRKRQPLRSPGTPYEKAHGYHTLFSLGYKLTLQVPFRSFSHGPVFSALH